LFRRGEAIRKYSITTALSSTNLLSSTNPLSPSPKPTSSPQPTPSPPLLNQPPLKLRGLCIIRIYSYRPGQTSFVKHRTSWMEGDNLSTTESPQLSELITFRTPVNPHHACFPSYTAGTDESYIL
jgi:hypothetical protein